MAERGGFEPPVRYDPYDGLANRCFRPLSHLSAIIGYERNIITLFEITSSSFEKNELFFERFFVFHLIKSEKRCMLYDLTGSKSPVIP